jgi:threonine/homoserine/homoserine lactone efflux protein
VTPKLNAIAVRAYAVEAVLSHFLAFLGVATVVICTPGQDTALTIRNTLLAGRPAGLMTAAGVSTGQAIWALASSAGVAALLRASAPAFEAVKLAGAAYLIWLGLQTIFRRPDEHAVPRRGGRTSFRQGVVSNLGNPKMAVFFPSLLPQFATAFGTLLALGLVFSAMTFVWLTGYAFAVAKAGDFLRRSRVRRTLDRITGVVLIALGLRIAAEHR